MTAVGEELVRRGYRWRVDGIGQHPDNSAHALTYVVWRYRWWRTRWWTDDR